ncbi:lycopene cyclase domain-containing protein [Sandaracinus amylolyticus]|uniref:Lycopene cyclase domain-containing protein n=1 Tax=Sandaracinus amylolyticus TaxID=927083 RepID=A0A0F6SDU6_9BACT|nr:lycopene cyclase domain-containing protein [Sandaracinus amylolyticus]AKF04059.1 hypothetical protein DB32_001208 [Sandaracinus amylolyticus]
MRHAFLFLALVLAIPGALAYLVRRDLRASIRFAALLSLPFALTEPLFYPEYWRPAFLFDLADRIGFGIEDVLFVTALAAASVASYPVVARATPAPIGELSRSATAVLRRLLVPGAVAVVVTSALVIAGVPAIYAALIAMVAAGASVWLARPDLIVPSIAGALITMVVYQSACLALAIVDPHVFHSVWRTRELSAVFVLGVPLEELLYGAASGLSASAIVPFARGDRLVRAASEPGTQRAAHAGSR